tara:strand:+ start:9210 stop:9650 length:441 start_codon:yes stop_codon:yes gene_type:complete
MSLDELKEQWKHDSTILDGNDGYPDFLKACNETPYLHSKYLDMYVDWKSRLIDKEFELKFKRKEKWMYYKKKAPASAYKEIPFDLKLTTKDEVEMFLDADEDLAKIKAKIKYFEMILFFLESVLKQISARQYQIKNAIEWEKFRSG